MHIQRSVGVMTGLISTSKGNCRRIAGETASTKMLRETKCYEPIVLLTHYRSSVPVIGVKYRPQLKDDAVQAGNPGSKNNTF